VEGLFHGFIVSHPARAKNARPGWGTRGSCR
jgi:hypothetical protein